MNIDEPVIVEREDSYFFVSTACVVLILGLAAFGYKVWNERQMTHAYERQAAALERIANALDGRVAGGGR